MKLHLLLAAALTAILGCETDSPSILESERASTCQIEGAVETTEQCACLGATLRPSPGGEIECLEGETEVGRVPLGIEGAVCCAAN